jgi:type VI secretion system secreted protein VgrG
MPGRQAVIALPIEQTARLERFDAVEGLSQLFVFTADVVCTDANVDFLPYLGQAAQVTVTQDGDSRREFSGLIYEVEFLEEVDAGYRFRLTLRPWLYALSRNQDFVIFQNKSTTQIIQEVFDSRHCSDVDFSGLSGTYAPREYCVQYRESDFAFVSRLMEEEGIYYFFQHRNGRHTMVLCDARSSHPDSAYPSLPYKPGKQGLLDDRFWRWTEHVVTGSEGKATFRSFDFTKPTSPLEASNVIGPVIDGAGGGDDDGLGARIDGDNDAPPSYALASETSEFYDFPADFLDNERGGALTQAKIQSIHNNRRNYRGEGDPVWLEIGTLLELEDHPLDRLNQSYLIVSMTYTIETESYVSGGRSSGTGDSVVVVVQATPADAPWRAPATTPKPVARGPETAIVTGPDGETIYTDNYGRVKVRFHWDRSDVSPDPTCFIRVSGSSADGGFGHVTLPRIGQEVVVDFINGNPDQPLIVGSVYNGAKTQPYPMPDDKTRSVWRSHTIQGGADDFNEISMEDKTGEEEMKVQAQKDRNTLVKNDDTEVVNHDKTTTVKNNLKMTVQEGDESREVTQGKRTTKIQGDDELTVNEGDHKTTVSMGDMTTTVSMGDHKTTVSMGDMSADVSLGDFNVKTDVGSVVVEATTQIELKVGGNSIVIDQTGVTIKGMMVSVEAQIELSAKGLMTEINGSAMTTVKGAIVMIN